MQTRTIFHSKEIIRCPTSAKLATAKTQNVLKGDNTIHMPKSTCLIAIVVGKNIGMWEKSEHTRLVLKHGLISWVGFIQKLDCKLFVGLLLCGEPNLPRRAAPQHFFLVKVHPNVINLVLRCYKRIWAGATHPQVWKSRGQRMVPVASGHNELARNGMAAPTTKK